ncbi:MAG: sigma-70 family RNA polymerase sigma factor [Candidatus Acidiferrum sp.]
MAAARLSSTSWKNSGNVLSDERRPVTDARLVAIAKMGHKPAFDELYQRHAEKMLHTTRRITRNREDAEDAVQECFLNAFVHLKSFDGRSRFSTWLTRIAVNAALMKLRKNRCRREVPMEASVEASELLPENLLPDPSLNPEERYAKCERELILRDAIATLRPGIRKAVETQLQDCSLTETAEILGISATGAKGRLFHARAALRKSAHLRFVVPSIWRNPEPGSHVGA